MPVGLPHHGGRSGFSRDPDHGAEMTCRTCWGTGREPISPQLRGKMAAERAQYIAPKRRAVEHTSPEGAPAYVIWGAEPEKTSEEWKRRNNPDLKGVPP